MKNILIIYFSIFLILCCNSTLYSQEEELKKNTLFIELLGNTSIYSVNYDRIVKNSDKYKISLRTGVMFFMNTYNDLYLGVPIELNCFYGKNNHFVEGGLGLTYFYINGKVKLYDDLGGLNEYPIHKYDVFKFVGRIGYRYQKDEGGLFLKVGLTPNITFMKSPLLDFNPWLGIAIGYTLR